MQFYKYKSFLICLLFFASTSFSFEGSELAQCFNSDFKTSISHKGMPFGLTETSLEINKEGCIFNILHTSLKYMKKRWTIDVCRGPVHIKYGAGSVDVLKREGSCATSSSEFCKKLDDLLLVLQDDGLIFAEGLKENLSDDHGKAFCTFSLMNSYLVGGNILNKDYDFTSKKVAPISSEVPSSSEEVSDVVIPAGETEETGTF